MVLTGQHTPRPPGWKKSSHAVCFLFLTTRAQEWPYPMSVKNGSQALTKLSESCDCLHYKSPNMRAWSNLTSLPHSNVCQQGDEKEDLEVCLVCNYTYIELHF